VARATQHVRRRVGRCIRRACRLMRSSSVHF
jgi:hypothetical protein